MVGVARIELATPAMSTQCSTTELHAHRQPKRLGERHLGGGYKSRNRQRTRRLKSPVLVLGLEHAVHLHHEILEVEGLGQQLRLGGCAPAL